jgi:MFS family permease
MGVLGFCLYAPYALLGLVGGALADRFERRRMMMATQSALALCAAALAIVVAVHADPVWVIDLIAVLRGVILVFNNPSRQALIVELVGRGELSNAIALNSSLNNATRIVGPAVAGILIATVGIAWCFALNALSFVAVIAALALMDPKQFHRAAARRRTPLATSIRDGLRYARRRKTVAVVLAMLFVVSTVAINFSVLLPILANQTLHGGPQTYGTITACFGAGALCGALVSASRARASRTLLIAAATGFGIFLLVVAPQRTLAGTALALFATGVCYTIYTSSSNAIVQLATPGFMQGRIGGLYSYVFLASGPLGSLLTGWLCERGGTDLAFAVAGGGTLLTVTVAWLTRPWPMPTGSVSRRASRR